MKSFLWLLSFVLASASFGQAGLPDTTFNQWRVQHFGNGFENNDLSWGNVEMVYAVKVQPDGKILVGGNFTTYNSKPANRIIRLNPDGSWDKTFQTSVQGYNVTEIEVLANNQILIAGDFNEVNGTAAYGIALLNPDGQLASGFSSGTAFISGNWSQAGIMGLTVQPDQKILVTGSFTTYNGVPCNGIVRLLPNGSIDPSFNTSGVDHYIYKILVQPDGKLIAAGYFTNCQGNTAVNICRLTANGDFDPTFQPGISTNTSAFIFDIAFQSNGKILACGNFSSFNGQTFGGLMRFNGDGSIDPAFLGGTSTFPYIRRCLKVLPDDSFYLGGNFLSYSGGIQSPRFLVKANPDGVYDSSFPIANAFNVDSQTPAEYQIMSLDVLNDGTVICGGQFDEYNGVLVKDLIRIKPDAKLDYSFLPFVGCNNTVFCTAVDQNNRILAGGSFTMYNNEAHGRFIRLNEDGTIDHSFNTGTGADDEVKSIAVQYDGKIILGGKFKHFNGVSRNSIVRLNTDGSVDMDYDPGNSFITVNGTTNWVNAIKLEANGSLLVAGKLHYVDHNSDLRNMVTRFYENGLLDGDFHPPFASYQEADLLEIQPVANKILVAGRLFYGIHQLNTDGTLNTVINQSEQTISLAVDNQDTIYSSGLYDQYYPGLLKKYNPHGILIGSSNVPAESMAFLPNGKILVYNTITLIRLNPDLSTDNSFESQDNTSTSSWGIHSISLQQHGQIIIGGFFKQYGDVITNHIGRVLNDVSYVPFIKLTFQAVEDISCANPGSAKAIGYSGTPPYSYSWNTVPVTNDSIATFTSPGIYSCTVTDVYGDSKTASILITGNPQNNFELRSFSIPGEFRPGFHSTYVVDAFNDGCVPVSGQLKLTYDNSLVSFVTATPNPSTVNGNTLIWNFQNWTADSPHFTPHIQFLTSVNAQIGDSVAFQTELTPLQNDFDSTNNLVSYLFPIVNGFDPNDKKVYPAGKCEEGYIDTDQKLTYQIRFQNTGNSEAININVVDQLNPNLDIRSVRIIAKSHPCWTEVLANNTLKFHFDEIHLIDSNANEPLSHGYLVFEVALNQNLSLPHNTPISNHAEIYFDFNPAVITNSVSNTIYRNSGTELEDFVCDPETSQATVSETTVYPNPTSGNLTIAFAAPEKTIKSAELADNQGRIIYAYSVDSDKLVIDMSHLTSGTYLLRVTYPDRKEVIRVLKTL
ncbi:T9SS type A sorting domain-containing protein [uncultured Fluviicola sp.]|uniref:DUF7619 domain-containing protein n=1 Tax=uncultured Fluviicola sp. TaxID=463303 RepID=UPI0025FEAE62|nr:T9SS type A sorting domain-containing protein [uncultured Fluviicola sp.]